MVDVFAGARVLSQDELAYRLLPYAGGDLRGASRLLPGQLAAARPRVILSRMLRNLQAIHAERGDTQALRAVERRLSTLAG
jgi:regulator of sirC expression with transglutaminase-like and TPR domain